MSHVEPLLSHLSIQKCVLAGSQDNLHMNTKLKGLTAALNFVNSMNEITGSLEDS